ncbi:hypothetical protein MTY66_39100 [Mycolicibacterium sp. TY66]|uniref:helix-turn-helix domain-containing protein n=1 Tax=unclassified Mycolicibacterium TaxID=2636767 RepID=UPI001BB394E1|nr:MULTISPECIES: helix-turn-helix transcriptional regulator [unclassified Mycolicibacterium]BCI82285.1 hypothetical protein MTY66_39100 [Mycolicibacterium sp. TY66]BCJ80069.1 hypothetical protein MTY81_14420 [Mycolicibacterium sp. TY81]
MVDAGMAYRQIAGVPQSEIERKLAGALGRRLAGLREERGLTQEALAEASGISRNHYQLLESGINNRKTKRPANPRLSTLVALSDALGMSAAELVAEVLSERD